MEQVAIPLDVLTAEDLSSLVEASFAVSTAEEAAPIATLTLLSTKTHLISREGVRQSFSILFRGEEDVALPQGMYWLSHPDLRLDGVFLVPLRPSGENRLYEAVFN